MTGQRPIRNLSGVDPAVSEDLLDQSLRLKSFCLKLDQHLLEIVENVRAVAVSVGTHHELRAFTEKHILVAMRGLIQIAEVRESLNMDPVSGGTLEYRRSELMHKINNSLTLVSGSFQVLLRSLERHQEAHKLGKTKTLAVLKAIDQITELIQRI